MHKSAKSDYFCLEEVVLSDFFSFIPSAFSRFSTINLYNFNCRRIHLENKETRNTKINTATLEVKFQ